MNALTRYFETSGDSIAKLAGRIGRSPSTITRPLRGERNVSMNVALEIEAGTGGAVTASEFVAICLDAKRQGAIDSGASANEPLSQELPSDTPCPIHLGLKADDASEAA